jgi:8-oxo-dGTP pyrophosphatase MutT (NUDIX family)
MSHTEKVYAYITNADRLLVFRHVEFPEAGIQVPGGTLDAGETPAEAVQREAREETGLTTLVLKKYLGKSEYRVPGTRPPETILRHFFHFTSPPDAPGTWQHAELHPSDGSSAPILFEFFWLTIDEAAQELNPYYTAKLQELFENLGMGEQDAW